MRKFVSAASVSFYWFRRLVSFLDLLYIAPDEKEGCSGIKQARDSTAMSSNFSYPVVHLSTTLGLLVSATIGG